MTLNMARSACEFSDSEVLHGHSFLSDSGIDDGIIVSTIVNGSVDVGDSMHIFISSKWPLSSNSRSDFEELGLSFLSGFLDFFS